MTKTWFDIDGTVPAVGIYTGEDDAPMYTPTAYIGTRTKFSTLFNYVPFVPIKTIGPVDVEVLGTVNISGAVMRRFINLGAHGVSGVPFVYGFVVVGGQQRPLCGTVPVWTHSSGSAITFTLATDSTNVYLVEARDYPFSFSGSTSRSVTVYVSDKTVL